MRPGVDHLVVALTVRDVARLVGALEALHSLARILEKSFLLLGDVKVLDTNGDSTARRVAEPKFLEPVEERNGPLESCLAIGLEHQLTQSLLLHVVVLVAELLRNDRVEHRATGSRIHPA